MRAVLRKEGKCPNFPGPFLTTEYIWARILPMQVTAVSLVEAGLW